MHFKALLTEGENWSWPVVVQVYNDGKIIMIMIIIIIIIIIIIMEFI